MLKYVIKIDREALADIQNAFLWYETQLKGLGNRYKAQVKKEINTLKNSPQKFAVRFADVRCKKISKFPFLIYYNIDEIKKAVKILAVFHTSRNPEIWTKR